MIEISLGINYYVASVFFRTLLNLKFPVFKRNILINSIPLKNHPIDIQKSPNQYENTFSSWSIPSRYWV